MDWKNGTRFADPAVEQTFQREIRQGRIPYVRGYAVMVGLVLLAYATLNPVFFAADSQVRFTLLLVPTLLCLGGYFGATFWRGYAERPMIDFTCLLSLAMLVTADNVVLFRELARQGSAGHANLAINGLIVTAFAAFALAGRTRWLVTFLALHATGFCALQLLIEPTLESTVYAIVSHLTGAAAMLFMGYVLGRSNRAAFLLRADLEVERTKTEELLYNVLPPVAAQRLKAGQVVADSFSDVSVVFIDVVGFTKLSSTVSPGHLIEMLNAFFRLADRCAAEHGVEKVKTIGDAYLAISGGNSPAANSADAALAFAEAVIAGLGEVKAASGIEIQVRIGVHSGPVVGGVIGATRMAYDYWGETMNVASRIEGQARPNGIAVSESTFMRTRRKDMFDLPELVPLKGVGDAPVFRLKAPEPPRIALAG